MANEDSILIVKDLTKKFGGLVALNNVSLQLARGEILGIIGPNGAGKTTLFNAIAGAFRVDKGDIIYKGKRVVDLRANERCHLGIARTFQITKPFGNMTVLDNVAVSVCYGKAGGSKGVSLQDLRAKALDSIELVGLTHKKDAFGNTLNIAERKRLELCRALATKPELLLLDEVIAGLNPTEVEEMMDLIKRINKTGVTILMIEHVMKAVMGISQRIIVLNFGKMLAEGKPEEISQNESVIAAYLGGGAYAHH